MSATTPHDPPPSRPGARPAPWRQFVAPAIMIALMIAAGRVAGARWPEIEQAVQGAGLAGQAVFVGAAALLAVCCFPMAALSLSAGALYGLWPGMLLLVLTCFLSALIMFAIGRGLLRGRILALIADRPRLAAIDRMVGERAVRLNLLTRLAPLNFGLSSYTLAAGRSHLGAYVVGTVGALPGSAVYVWLGWAARGVGGQDANTTGGVMVLIIGVVAVGLLSWLMARLVRQAWREAGVVTDAAVPDPSAEDQA